MNPETTAPSPSSAARLKTFEPMTTPAPIVRGCWESAEIDDVISGLSAASAATTPSSASESPRAFSDPLQPRNEQPAGGEADQCPNNESKTCKSHAASPRTDNLPTKLPGSPNQTRPEAARFRWRRAGLPCSSQARRPRIDPLRSCTNGGTSLKGLVGNRELNLRDRRRGRTIALLLPASTDDHRSAEDSEVGRQHLSCGSCGSSNTSIADFRTSQRVRFFTEELCPSPRVRFTSALITRVDREGPDRPNHRAPSDDHQL